MRRYMQRHACVSGSITVSPSSVATRLDFAHRVETLDVREAFKEAKA